jgi:glycerol-3-phosphate dehydrogenase (NAD(P)+)
MTADVAIVGGGPFAVALAKAVERAGHDVLVYSRSRRGEATKRIELTDDASRVGKSTLVFLAVPSPYIREVADRVGRHLDGRHYLVHVSRGLVGDDLTPISRVLREVTPARRVAVLGGPLVIRALAEGLPAGAIVGSRFPEVVDSVRQAIASPVLRIYSTRDVVGVEVASAMVGLLALVAGFARGFGMGPATLAVMMTRGLVEAARIGVSLGAEERTFSGLAGFGDAFAVAAGDDRPEIRAGQALANGEKLESAVQGAGTFVEAVTIARRVALHAERMGVEAPISAAIASVLDGHATVSDAIMGLMSRPSKSE